MKGRIQTAFLMVLILLLMAGCHTGMNQIQGDNAIGSDINMQDNDANNADVGNESDEPSYTIKSLNYDEKDISINYPSIDGLSDTDKQNQINDILEREAFVIINEVYEGYTENLSLNFDYQIVLKSNDLLSVQFQGFSFAKGAAHPLHLFNTANIDMNQGSKLMLRDLVKIDENFVDKYRSEVADLDKNEMEGLKYVIDSYSDENLLAYFNGADTSFEESWTYSYLAKDAIGISLEAPYVAGCHIEVELKYEDIKDNVKADNPIWAKLIK